ncbi:sulfite exporter TauE/SafE family protein [Paracoccus spongiarum]|uniref:Probable membrane transporter protein n=1 Tax=Paracoccus spongiarum TaxID=3064387 RepID=A0ABT9JGL0_9RHOB|nr:sulfite exporter TauE/SafE family protein [Paracoccus sp. 2205BS29-5]MDP5308924.1 sulfite exporter TauE/SafE family protein [Paracoccus sp. 2205BS29-5]
MFDFVLLFVAGLVGGMLNAVAGGGTFITFPALVFTGVPPIAANATTTVAALPGYLAATLGFRRDIAAMDGAPMLKLTGWTAAGGALGCALLLVSSNEIFSVLVPFLLLAATVVFYWSEPIRAYASRWRSVVTPFGLGTLLPMAIYGGYFNGGLGIIMLAVFAMWGMTELHQMNGLKSWLSFALAVIAFAVFAIGGKIVWGPAAIMSAGTIIGGYAGAPVARRIPRQALRLLIAAVGFGMTAIFFWRLLNGV